MFRVGTMAPTKRSMSEKLLAPSPKRLHVDHHEDSGNASNLSYVHERSPELESRVLLRKPATTGSALLASS